MGKRCWAIVLGVICLAMVGCAPRVDEAVVDVDVKEEIAVDTGAEEEIAVDLTTLSSTMVYAEVFNMMNNPADYEGATVKLSGSYVTSYYEPSEQYYHFILIADALACCAQGIEFVWDGEYPPEEAMVEAIGVFGSYEEMGTTFYHLTLEALTVL